MGSLKEFPQNRPEWWKDIESAWQKAFDIETVGIIFFDTAGDITRANDAFLHMSGYTRDDLAARRLRWDRLTPPEFMDASRRAIAQLKTLGNTVPYEKQYIRKDGSRFWGLFAAQALNSHEGVEFILDITDRKCMQTELQHSREDLERSKSQLQLIIDSLRACIAYLSPDLRIVRANRSFAELCRRPVAELLQGHLEEAQPEMFSQLSPSLQAALRGETQEFETQLALDGEQLTCSVNVLPDRDPNSGSICGVILRILDLTERKRTEAVLRTTEKLAAVGRLASSIAHEINNPLASVTNLLYLCRHTDDPALLQQYLELAEQELRRVSIITTQTLQFQRERPTANLVPYRDLLESILTMLHGRIIKAGVTVEDRSSAPELLLDAEFRQVLINLVVNALDAIPAGGGRIFIRDHKGTDWRTGRQGIILTVADTGIGMSPDTLQHIFEPFFTSKEIGGTGLGLWVTKGIVERYQGRIKVRSSQRPNCSGTVFTVFVPR